MSRTDKTRPWRVKMLDNPSNYRESHNHGKRAVRDANGEIVRVPIEGEFWSNGRQKTRIVEADHPECDLPDDPRQDDNDWDQCHYTYTSRWITSGEARCPCYMCHGYGRDVDNSKRRRDGKKECREWRREWDDA